MTNSSDLNITNPKPTRRGMMTWIIMIGGLAASYGTAAVHALRYLTPNRKPRIWKAYAGGVHDIPAGTSKIYNSPDGRKVVITNTGEQFTALSDVCPHLGCKVHWNESSKQFICPCHNGVFDVNGVAISGPPAKAGQRLAKYEIQPVDSALYITLTEG
ncbi:MAG: Rieske (2Fe-2S) protein [Planctomycetes bacterium]|nr:Rieske (2Fe-2S) protein [Planctomycetota bacterium]